MNGYRDYTVTERAVETPTVVTLRLVPAEGALPAFIPGQFVNATLTQFGAEAKSYSIASIPGADTLSLAVKPKREFSHALVSLKPGDTLQLSEPCGFFYPEDDTTPRIFVAGGIGIVPFMSMLRSAEAEGTTVPTVLLYSNRLAGDRPFFAELTEHEKAGRCAVRHFITGESHESPAALSHRIGADDLASAKESLPGAHFFLCGGIEFVRDMRLALKSIGVSESAIFTEAFF